MIRSAVESAWGERLALLYLLVLAVPIAMIGALVVAVAAHNRLTRVEARLLVMERRLADLATAGGAGAPVVPAPAPAPQALAQPPSAEPAPPEPESASAIPPAAGPARPSVPRTPPLAGAADAPAIPGFEERFGTRWTVWVGGIALALGGIFLVRYSIEQGLIGPGLRIVFGALLAAGLMAAGEWTRRRENLSGFIGLPTAHIPSILTAAGTTVAYATVYAAYDLYGFLPPAPAFLLLGAVALSTLAAALLHGPALAALGLIGAYLTPILVAAPVPNYWALYVYLAFVTAAAFALARARLWRWLVIAAIVFGMLWIFPGVDRLASDAIVPHAFHAVIGFALVAIFIVPGLALGPEPIPGRIDEVASTGLAAYLSAAAVLVLATRHDGAALAAFALVAAATVGIAWRAEAAIPAVAASGLLTALVLADWAVPAVFEQLILPGGPAAGAVPEPRFRSVEWHLMFGGTFAVLFGAAGFLAQGRSQGASAPMVWAATAVLAPIAILMALYYRIAGFERSIPFASLALLLAALYATATEILGRRRTLPGLAAAGAIFASGAVAALALALTLALERGWLTIGLALMVPGIAWIAEKRPLPILRWVAAIVMLLVLARVGWEPRIVGRDVGTTPIFNWLLYGYGGPATGFWLGGYLLRRRADDLPTRMLESAAILFTVLLAFTEIRHWMTGGDMYRPHSSLDELGLQVSTGLAIAIGLEHVRARTGSVVHDAGALAVAGLTALAIVVGLGITQNPLSTGREVGGPFLNSILLAYGLPAMLAAVLALVARGRRPQEYRVTAAVFAVGLTLGYLSLEVMRLYQGSVLSLREITEAEQYTHSAIWLLFGVVLLFVGILLRSQPARLASAAVILITVAKVFLLDLAGLQGVFRALSFLGLGLVLVGIGWLYQRLLFPRPTAARASAAPEPSPSS